MLNSDIISFKLFLHEAAGLGESFATEWKRLEIVAGSGFAARLTPCGPWRPKETTDGRSVRNRPILKYTVIK